MRTLGARVLQVVPVMFLVSLATFMMVELMPGDPAIAILGRNATPETIAAVRDQLGLDEPVIQRYLEWVGDAVTGDLGESITTGQPVWEALSERLPVTVELAVLAQLIAVGLAVPIGVWSAYRQGRWFDRTASTTAFGLVSVPSFLLAVLLVYLVALQFDIFPVSGWVRLTEDPWSNLHHAFLPAVSLAMVEFAVYSQLVRSDMVATLQEDYILSAKAKGMPTWHVLMRHAMRPSSFSLITLAGVSLGRLIGGTLIIEVVFGLAGVGTLLVQEIPNKNLPVIQGVVLVLASAYVLIITLVDLSYAFLDPRVRRGSH